MCHPVIDAASRAHRFILVVLLLTLPATVDRAEPANGVVCKPAGALTQVPGLQEGSGAATSRRAPEHVWTHNDSGQPILTSLDSKGTVLRRVHVAGAQVEDWEAIASGPCPDGNCIFIGDIGDNDGKRRSITIYRLPEPADASDSATVTAVIRATYPQGAQNAETMLVTPKGEILIVTKGTTGPVELFRVPADAAPGKPAVLQPVGKPREPGKSESAARITDGAISPDGSWIALRTNTEIAFYRTTDLMAGHWREAGRVSLKSLGEPQGEGIAFADDKTLYLIGEGGGKSRPGTFARLTCTF
jgi:hypothetical protein